MIEYNKIYKCVVCTKDMGGGVCGSRDWLMVERDREEGRGKERGGETRERGVEGEGGGGRGGRELKGVGRMGRESKRLWA